jgi:hypothetical protein
MTRNWTPVTESLFRHLHAAGATITHVNDGEGWEETPTQADALYAATGIDVAHLRVRLNEGPKYTLLLVYGNAPHELVADWSYSGPGPHTAIDQAIARFSEEWEDKPCPTIAD